MVASPRNHLNLLGDIPVHRAGFFLPSPIAKIVASSPRTSILRLPSSGTRTMVSISDRISSIASSRVASSSNASCRAATLHR
jgi:hypothetical protein